LYANATNIYADSDIDVVVLYEKTYYWDVSALTPDQQHLHQSFLVPATYPWLSLRDDVLAALRSYYGNSRAWLGKKSIKVETGNPTQLSTASPDLTGIRTANALAQGLEVLSLAENSPCAVREVLDYLIKV